MSCRCLSTKATLFRKGKLSRESTATTKKEPQQRQAQASLAAQSAQLQQVIIASQSAEGTLDANLNAAEARLNQATTAVDLAAKEEVRYRERLKADTVSASLYDSYKSRLVDALAAQAATQAGMDSKGRAPAE